MGHVTLDFETRSRIDLKRSNAWAYAEHSSTEVICLCWNFGGNKGTWVPNKLLREAGVPETSDDIPPALASAAARSLIEFDAHNAGFEIAVWTNIMVLRFGWPEIALPRWRDTQAVAAYRALPTGLDKLTKLFGLGGKDPEGDRLITRYSKLHLKTAKPIIPWDDLQKFVKYCRHDVMLEHRIRELLGWLPDDEQQIWLEDMAMNLAGLYLDRPGIEAASEVVETEKKRIAGEFRKITGLSPSQNTKVLTWLQEQGYEGDNLNAATVEATDLGSLSAKGSKAMALRQAYNKSSTSKLAAMLRNISADGRARMQSRYHGAATGRNTGAGFQPLNLPRGDERIEPEQLVRDINTRDPVWLNALYGNPTTAVSNALRHYITAAPGYKLVVGDFSSIEAVVLAVLANEEWKVEAFRNKEPIYERTADKIYKFEPGTVTKKTHPDERQDGKICELACGYQGSVGAWRKFDLSDRHDDDAVRGHVRAWRKSNPNIVAFWEVLDDSFKHAIKYCCEVEINEYLACGADEDFAWIELPNGKRIWYAKPMLAWGMPVWHNVEENDDCAEGTCSCEEVLQPRYMTWKFGGWRRAATYGGKLAENVCQAVTRELIKQARGNLILAGYKPVLDVYDEVVTEMPIGQGSAEEMIVLMEKRPEWAADWPISVSAWEGERYRK